MSDSRHDQLKGSPNLRQEFSLLFRSGAPDRIRTCMPPGRIRCSRESAQGRFAHSLSVPGCPRFARSRLRESTGSRHSKSSLRDPERCISSGRDEGAILADSRFAELQGISRKVEF
jgi:hypothetical protein